MKFRPFLKILAFTLLATSAVANAATKPSMPFIGKGQAMTPPRGFVAMCKRDPSACGPLSHGVTEIPSEIEADWQYHSATGAIGCDVAVGMGRSLPVARVSSAQCLSVDLKRMARLRDAPLRPAVTTNAQDHNLLDDVNRVVNGRVRQLTDRQIYGTDEYWTRSTLAKDAQGDCEDLALEKQHELIARGFDPQKLFLAVVYRSQVGLHTVLVARLADGDFVLDSRTPYVDIWNEVAYSWVVVQDAVNPSSWYKPERDVKVASAGALPLKP